MPPLEPHEEAIVAAYIENGGNQTEAWKATHPGSKAKPQSMHVQASKFFSQDKVRLRIVELQAEVVQRISEGVVLTLESHMKKLSELRDEALNRGQISAAIQAEVKRGELCRLYVKQIESTVTNISEMSDAELARVAASGSHGIASQANGSKKLN